MTYYKIICDTELIGVATQIDLRKHQKKHNLFLSCNEQDAQYIELDGILYRSNWMAQVADENIFFKMAEISEIEQSEYLILKESGESYLAPADEEDNVEESAEQSVEEEVTLEYVKTKKIESLSQACRQAITDGVDVMLEDGEIHHFSLTIQDQLNIITLTGLIRSDEDVSPIPYHADGEDCRYFSFDDISEISAAVTDHKIYHTTYFNSLKKYVEAQKTIEKVSNISYGMTIPKKYRTEVLSKLISENET